MIKIDIYGSRGEYISILRSIDKMVVFFEGLEGCHEKNQIVQSLW